VNTAQFPIALGARLAKEAPAASLTMLLQAPAAGEEVATSVAKTTATPIGAQEAATRAAAGPMRRSARDGDPLPWRTLVKCGARHLDDIVNQQRVACNGSPFSPYRAPSLPVPFSLIYFPRLLSTPSAPLNSCPVAFLPIALPLPRPFHSLSPPSPFASPAPPPFPHSHFPPVLLLSLFLLPRASPPLPSNLYPPYESRHSQQQLGNQSCETGGCNICCWC